MWHESSCTNAYNPEAHKGCSGSYGPTQTACLHFKKGENPKDISTNIRVAYSVYEEAKYSFKPWSTCSLVRGCS